MLQALRTGDPQRAAAIFAERAGIPAERIGEILSTGPERDLAAACRAAGFERLTLASIFLLVRADTAPGAEAEPRALSRLLGLYDSLDRRAARQMLAGGPVDGEPMTGESPGDPAGDTPAGPGGEDPSPQGPTGGVGLGEDTRNGR